MKVDIAQMTPGTAPDGFVEALTGQGGKVRWQVLNDPTSPAGKVIAETSRDNADYRFPLCIYNGFDGKDVAVAIRFKAVKGEVDRAGGIIVRALDANNYYVARANALEDNVRLYKVVGGARRQIAGRNLEVRSGVWHTLTLRVAGDALEVLFNDASMVATRDQAFPHSGKVGLWTKSDSLTHFAELDVTPRDATR
jgi:hypothetical protein